jgi:hypothetical protein
MARLCWGRIRARHAVPLLGRSATERDWCGCAKYWQAVVLVYVGTGRIACATEQQQVEWRRAGHDWRES